MDQYKKVSLSYLSPLENRITSTSLQSLKSEDQLQSPEQFTQSFQSIHINDDNEFEKKIFEWLDLKGIQMVNPANNCDQFFQRKKSSIFSQKQRSHQNGQIQQSGGDKGNEDDCLDDNNNNNFSDKKPNSLSNSTVFSLQSLGNSLNYNHKNSADLSNSSLYKRRSRKNTISTSINTTNNITTIQQASSN